jgi:hypothetical protein
VAIIELQEPVRLRDVAIAAVAVHEDQAVLTIERVFDWIVAKEEDARIAVRSAGVGQHDMKEV